MASNNKGTYMSYEFADRLIELRREHKMSQEELANALGVSRQAVSKWERAESAPDISNLVALAKLYGITLDDLVHGIEEQPSEKDGSAEPAPPQGDPVILPNEAPQTETHEDEKPKPPEDTPGVENENEDTTTSQPTNTFHASGAWKTFPYPLLCVVIFLFLGFFFGLWHPSWIIFLTIPFYYWVVNTISKGSNQEAARNQANAGNSSAANEQGSVSKPATSIKVILIILLCLVLCGGLFTISYGCSNLAYQFGKHYANNAVGEGFANVGAAPVNAEGVRNLELMWAAGSVDIVIVEDDASNGNIMLIEDENIPSGQQLHWQVSGETLQIAYGQDGVGVQGCSTIRDKHLVIEIPKSVATTLGYVDISGASGTYNIDAINCDELEIQLASGQVNGNGITANNWDFDVASGKVKIAGECKNLLSLSLASGDIDLTSTTTCPQAATIDVMSGNASIYLPGDSQLEVRADKLSGNFNCEFPTAMIYHDEHHSYQNRDVSIFDVNMTSGNVTLQPIRS